MSSETDLEPPRSASPDLVSTEEPEVPAAEVPAPPEPEPEPEPLPEAPPAEEVKPNKVSLLVPLISAWTPAECSQCWCFERAPFAYFRDVMYLI